MCAFTNAAESRSATSLEENSGSPSTQTIEDAEVHQEDVDDTDIGLEYSKDDMAPPTTGPAAARVAYAAPMLVGVLRHIPFSSWHES